MATVCRSSLETNVKVITSVAFAQCVKSLSEAMVAVPKTGAVISKITSLPSKVAVTSAPVLPEGSS